MLRSGHFGDLAHARGSQSSNLRQSPWVASLSIEPRIRLVVADESPVLRVSAQLAPVPIRLIGQMTHRGAPRPGFDLCHRPFPRPDAIDPIAMMAR